MTKENNKKRAMALALCDLMDILFRTVDPNGVGAKDDEVRSLFESQDTENGRYTVALMHGFTCMVGLFYANMTSDEAMEKLNASKDVRKYLVRMAETMIDYSVERCREQSDWDFTMEKSVQEIRNIVRAETNLKLLQSKVGDLGEAVMSHLVYA
jgi:hypothetical protein